MIKWSEFQEGGVLYEAFLPEHEREACEWLLRASCRGHVLAERRHPLAWPPKFGPDAGDVAVLEGMAEVLIADLATAAVAETDGTYVPAAADLSPPEPFLHALLYAVVEQYAQAEASIGLSDEQTAAYLGLPVRASASGLYPFAVTPDRDGRMRRLIALDHVLKHRMEVRVHRAELLGAVLACDITRLRAVLESSGVSFESDRANDDSDS